MEAWIAEDESVCVFDLKISFVEHIEGFLMDNVHFLPSIKFWTQIILHFPTTINHVHAERECTEHSEFFFGGEKDIAVDPANHFINHHHKEEI